MPNPGAELDGLRRSMGLSPLGICPTENRKVVATRVDRRREEGLIKQCATAMDHSLATHRAQYTFSATVDSALEGFRAMQTCRQGKGGSNPRDLARQFIDLEAKDGGGELSSEAATSGDDSDEDPSDDSEDPFPLLPLSTRRKKKIGRRQSPPPPPPPEDPSTSDDDPFPLLPLSRRKKKGGKRCWQSPPPPPPGSHFPSPRKPVLKRPVASAEQNPPKYRRFTTAEVEAIEAGFPQNLDSAPSLSEVKVFLSKQPIPGRSPKDIQDKLRNIIKSRKRAAASSK